MLMVDGPDANIDDALTRTVALKTMTDRSEAIVGRDAVLVDQRNALPKRGDMATLEPAWP